MTKDYEFYHGVVFTKLIHCAREPISLKTYSADSKASYILNSAIGLYIKHSTKRLSPWTFSFQKEHQDEIQELKNSLKEVFLILVCGDDGIVTLGFAELKKILDESHSDTEWISASRTPRKEYKVKGSDGTLSYKVSHVDFIDKILKAVETYR
jgi:hypothetical protein